MAPRQAKSADACDRVAVTAAVAREAICKQILPLTSHGALQPLLVK
jgi:hypothetical protein